MSTRCYPLYQRGGPQLRVFLPNFWMKLVKPTVKVPPSTVQFACSMEMTIHDIKNYLEKIYNVKTVQVRSRIALGKTRQDPGKGYVIKEDDVKYAYVTLPKGETFNFPDLYPASQDEERKKEEKGLDAAKDIYQKSKSMNRDRSNIPGWFSI